MIWATKDVQVAGFIRLFSSQTVTAVTWWVSLRICAKKKKKKKTPRKKQVRLNLDSDPPAVHTGGTMMRNISLEVGKSMQKARRASS